MILRDQRPWPDRLLGWLDGAPGSGLARVLAGPAAVYALAARLKRVLTPDQALPDAVPSLGIGNLRVGGTGKTPVVEDLGSRLAAEGERVAVLTRGYRGEGGGDEPAWLEGGVLTVVADANRHRGFTRAIQGGATRVLLDDALQTRHRPRWTVALVLDRDLVAPPRALPAGPAREGACGLERADALFVRREGKGAGALARDTLGFRLAPAGFVDPAGDELPAAPRGRALLVSGLARPESFEADAMATGIEVAGSWREADHWRPGAASADEIVRFAATCGAAWVLVPEKNLQRVAALQLGLPLVALRSRIEWDDRTDPLTWLRDRGIAV